mmetsp:Transcript_27068/g.64298  ORF Transcript_27068/g.64298 Transcript_27068/m.64298 type:complete len:230 (-) Transcript_27068:395-1084(-)
MSKTACSIVFGLWVWRHGLGAHSPKTPRQPHKRLSLLSVQTAAFGENLPIRGGEALTCGGVVGQAKVEGCRRRFTLSLTHATAQCSEGRGARGTYGGETVEIRLLDLRSHVAMGLGSKGGEAHFLIGFVVVDDPSSFQRRHEALGKAADPVDEALKALDRGTHVYFDRCGATPVQRGDDLCLWHGPNGVWAHVVVDDVSNLFPVAIDDPIMSIEGFWVPDEHFESGFGR